MSLEEYGKVTEKYDLINNNTYKVHSICNYFIEVDDVVKLTKLINYLNKEGLKYLIIGNGSNIILPSTYDGIVIKLSFYDLEIDNEYVTVGSSYMINKLAMETVNHNLTGLEWASGIPGTIGASIYGNAGAYKDEISNYIEEIEVLENNKVKILKKNDIFFDYRETSLQKKNIIILKAKLKLNKGNKEESLAIIKDRLERREASQPLDFPSAGSVFRNPEGLFAGKLIEDLGLKGKSIGGAMVSEKHANFIINTGNATGEDVINLIKLIITEVKKEYNVDLVLEQKIIN